MACGNTYTPAQAQLASRSRVSLRHRMTGSQLSKNRIGAIRNALTARDFDSRGQDGLPRLQVFKNDKMTIKTNSDMLIWRPAAAGLANKPPIGVAFAHSLDNRKYKGFSLTKIRNAKYQILAGKRTEFHFVTTESFPAEFRNAILEANEEIREKRGDGHQINFHKVKRYPFDKG